MLTVARGKSLLAIAFSVICVCGGSQSSAQIAESTDFTIRVPLPGAIANATAEEQAASFAKHLEVVSGAWKGWVDQTAGLTADQRTRLDILIADTLRQHVQGFVPITDWPEKPVFSPVLPYLAALENSPTRKFTADLSRQTLGMLEQSQRQQVEQAQAQRNSSRLKAYRNYVLSKLHWELFLTPDQRTVFEQQFDALPVAEQHPFQTWILYPAQQSLGYRNLWTWVGDQGKGVLSEAQWNRHRVLPEPRLGIWVPYAKGRQAWEELADATVERWRGEVINNAEMRIAYLQSRMELSEDQVRGMRLLSRGATTEMTEDWSRRTRETFDNRETGVRAFNREGTFYLDQPWDGSDCLEKSALWLNGLRRNVFSGNLPAAVLERYRLPIEARSDMVLSVYDEQLWLLPAQRDQLRARLMQVLGGREELRKSVEPYAELAWIALPLMSPGVGPILSAAQVQVWKDMQSRSTPNERERYVIPTLNGYFLILEWSDF